MWIVASALLAVGIGSIFGWMIFSGKQNFFPLLRRSLCLGFLVQLSFLFLARSLPLQMVITAFFALLGSYVFFFQWKKNTLKSTTALLFLSLAAIYLLRILLEPIQQWDARSVWFFQGKILYYAQGLGNIWDAKHFLFGNFDYPKLHALLAAQSAQLAGIWNEYLPKFSLFLLLLPPLCFFAERAQRNGFFLAALLAGLLVPGSLLWEGYMDGYFSLYALMSLVSFATFFRTQDRDDFFDGLLAAGIALSLKNEGLLFLVACIVSIIGLMLLTRVQKKEKWKLSFFFQKRAVFLALVIGLPFLLWLWEKTYYQIPSQMFFQPLTWSEIWDRISFSSFYQILKSASFHGKVLPALALFLVALPLGGWKYFRRNSLSFQFLGIWALIYFLGISYALYSNSMELYLPQHLYHVMDRLMLVVVQASFAGILLFSSAHSEERHS